MWGVLVRVRYSSGRFAVALAVRRFGVSWLAALPLACRDLSFPCPAFFGFRLWQLVMLRWLLCRWLVTAAGSFVGAACSELPFARSLSSRFADRGWQ